MTTPVHKIMRHPWLASFAFWQVSALIFIVHRFFTTIVDQAPVNWPAFIASMEALHISWGLLTVPVFQWLQKSKIQNSGKWILVSVVVACIHSIVNTLLFSLMIVFIPSHLGIAEDEILFRIIRFLVASPLISWIVAVLILLAWYGWTFFVQYEEQYTRAAQLQNELISSQLQMLRMQLNPHFIFNAFNTISMMMRTERIQEATTTLSRIAELFRTSLLKSEHQQILLSEEINFCKQYLAIESIRFSDRLKVSFDVDPAADQCPVPSMILQPLIENAFKHGLMNQLDEHAELKITTRLEGTQRLLLEVSNTGRLKREPDNEGIGLNNLRKRLLLSYPDAASFSLQQVDNRVVARIKIML